MVVAEDLKHAPENVKQCYTSPLENSCVSSRNLEVQKESKYSMIRYICWTMVHYFRVLGVRALVQVWGTYVLLKYLGPPGVEEDCKAK